MTLIPALATFSSAFRVIRIVGLIGVVGIVLGTVAHSAATFDASILKNGNSWLYIRQESTTNVVTMASTSYSGTTRFSMSQVVTAGDTTTFRVIREDNGTLYNSQPPEGGSVYTYPHTYDTVTYKQSGGAFTPSIPFFAVGQVFDDSLPTHTTFGGKFLKIFRNSDTSGCQPASVENVESIGRTKDYYASVCSSASITINYRLIQTNGRVFNSDSLVVVPVRQGPVARARATATPAPMVLPNGRVLYGLDGFGELFNLTGRRARP